MTELLKGAPVAAALDDKTLTKTAALKARSVTPTLAILRVGKRPDDIAYENGAVKRCEKTGVATERIALPGDASQDDLLREIKRLNASENIHGILLFRPLPKYMDESLICNAISPEKDIDGVTNISMAGVFSGAALGFPPCTPQACMEILDYYNIDCASKNAVVVGRSLVIGKPVTMALIKRNATVTVCHTKTIDMPGVCRGAEILIAAAGRAGIIDKKCFSENQIVIDVGINIDANGKLAGDVNFAEAGGIVKAITPVPGGVGTVTTSVLAKHVAEAAEKAALRKG